MIVSRSVELLPADDVSTESAHTTRRKEFSPHKKRESFDAARKNGQNVSGTCAPLTRKNLLSSHSGRKQKCIHSHDYPVGHFLLILLAVIVQKYV